VAEWSNAAVSKTVIRLWWIESSNLSLSAILPYAITLNPKGKVIARYLEKNGGCAFCPTDKKNSADFFGEKFPTRSGKVSRKLEKNGGCTVWSTTTECSVKNQFG
jgi:hypothetical protein